MVSLVLLPALNLPPAACSALYQPAGERRLPHAPAAAASLQPPYVRIQGWAAAAAARDAVRRCISAGGGSSDLMQLFVLDTETTGLSSTRDHIHQLSVLNIASGQLLSLLLRACPGILHPSAASRRDGVCGLSNDDVHSPQRPTFLQVAPLLSAFMSAGRSPAGGSGSGGSGGSGASTCACGSGSCSRRTGGACTPACCMGASSSAADAPIVVAAHNARFDARLVAAEFGRRALPLPAHWRWLDTLPLARSALPGRKGGHSLGALQHHFGLQLLAGQALHDACTDVGVLTQLLPHLLDAPGGAGSSGSGSKGGRGSRRGESASTRGGMDRWLQDFAQITARKTPVRGKAAAAAAEAGAAAEDGLAAEAEAQRFTCPWCLQRVTA